MHTPSPALKALVPHDWKAIEGLIADLGLAGHPAVGRLWAGACALGGLPRTAWGWGAPLSAALTRLGHRLAVLRPYRHSEILAVWQALPVPLHWLRLRWLDVDVVADATGTVRVRSGGRSSPVSVGASKNGPVSKAIDAIIGQERLPFSLVLRVRMEGLTAAQRTAADCAPWEDRLGVLPPGAAHVVRCVRPAGDASRTGTGGTKDSASLESVGFVGDMRRESASSELAVLRSVWGARARPGLTQADVVHVHSHGLGGLSAWGSLAELRASVMVFHVCEGALPGGVVSEAVATGRSRDAMGFSHPVLAETGTQLSGALHAGLCDWSDEGPLGVVFAALRGRQAMGHRPSARGWRHYSTADAAPRPCMAGSDGTLRRSDALHVGRGRV